ncbi:UNKNOWN [Stylonychia lemnae]|uniref:Homologous-pairing protein 2 winged helix domain-containing protein n=1 Tax=Stylonychia lemnae TaxID=5949 RepID=A0A078B953_STYLE|nr:UNKNOWN [Stylonychia lemnae]|eukprot:CDW90904.1 UNKNOWN [Stylonychia lemnae]
MPRKAKAQSEVADDNKDKLNHSPNRKDKETSQMIDEEVKASTKATNKTRGSSRSGAARKSFYVDSSDDDENDIADDDDEEVVVAAPKNKKSVKQAKPPKKVRKTNDGGDIKEEAKKQQAQRKQSKPISVIHMSLTKNQYKVDDSDESEGGQDISDESDDFQVNEVESSDQESSKSEDEEEKGNKKGKQKTQNKSKELVKESKKRTRDGKIKQISKDKNDKKDAADKGKPAQTSGNPLGGGGGHREKDDGGKKMMTDKEAYAGIKEYMIKVKQINLKTFQANRPYSLQNVLDNMHGRVKKVQGQKVLDDLTDQKTLTCKEFGKAKVYLANQDNFPTTSNEELLKLDQQIKTHKDNLQLKQNRLKELQNQLKDVCSGLNNIQMKAEIERLKIENENIRTKTQKYEEGNIQMISEEEINEKKKDLLKYGIEWKKRKRACMEITR